MRQLRITRSKRRRERRTDLAPLDALPSRTATAESDELLRRIDELLGVG